MREHIAFFVIPEFADVNPTLSVVATLVRRGHRITYVTTDQFRRNVTDVGAEFVQCAPFQNQAHPSDDTSLVEGDPADAFALRTLATVTAFYNSNKPDLIVHDYLCFAGRILAATLRVPTVQVAPDFALDRDTPSTLVPEFYETVLRIADERRPFLTQHEIPSDSWYFHRGELNVYFYPKFLQLDAHEFDETCFYAGRCAAERPYRPTWRPKSCGGKPVALVSTSTSFIQGSDYFRMCIEALSGLKYHVVLALGENNDPRSLEPLPPHFEILKGTPQIEVMPHAELLICLGGMTTTSEALYHGIPMLMITHGHLEAEAYAENNASRGLGIHLRKAQTTAGNIRDSALRISKDYAILSRVKELQYLIRRSPGAEETANRLEEYLATVAQRPSGQCVTGEVSRASSTKSQSPDIGTTSGR
jgi:MGT family glycosyltransferase